MSDEIRDPTTVELVQRAQAGDVLARDALFARYSDRVLAIARVRLGAKLRGALESTDILQEALAEAVRGFDRFEMRDESGLIRWLAKLVEHRITAKASYHRAAKRAATVVSLEQDRRDGSKTRTLEIRADNPTPSAELARREEQDAVQQALAELPEHHRELILLRDYAGSSWEEIAAEVGAPSAAAARMMHARALTKLGALLRARGV